MDITTNRKILLPAFFALLWIASAFQNTVPIRYSQPATVSGQPAHLRPFYIDFQDSTSNDTLFMVTSKEGYPLSYFRKIQTSVCFDNKCRLMDIVLYWNITGRYLGFELPEKEFLSKTDHEPFVANDYERLHQILADPRSPIANFTYNQLSLPPVRTPLGIDAVTAPTSPAVLEHVVPGAVYTTYKLWHLVYGRTQHEITRITQQALSPELMLRILESPQESDRMWGLNQINGHIALTPALRAKVVGMISDKNYSLAERAVNSISPAELQSDTLQQLLLHKFFETDYSLKKLLIDKIKAAPILNPRVKNGLAENMGRLDGEILIRVLEVFQQHRVSDTETVRRISALLEDDNYFISKKAYNFLQAQKVKEPEVSRKLQLYRTTHNL